MHAYTHTFKLSRSLSVVAIWRLIKTVFVQLGALGARDICVIVYIYDI